MTVLCVKHGITQGGRESCIYYQGDFIFLGVGKGSPLGSGCQDHLIGGTSTYVPSSSTKPDTIAICSISPPFSINNFVIKEGATSEHFRFYAHPDRNCLLLYCLCVCIYHVSHSLSVFFAAILLVIISLDFIFFRFHQVFFCSMVVLSSMLWLYWKTLWLAFKQFMLIKKLLNLVRGKNQPNLFLTKAKEVLPLTWVEVCVHLNIAFVEGKQSIEFSPRFEFLTTKQNKNQLYLIASYLALTGYLHLSWLLKIASFLSYL